MKSGLGLHSTGLIDATSRLKSRLHGEGAFEGAKYCLSERTYNHNLQLACMLDLEVANPEIIEATSDTGI